LPLAIKLITQKIIKRRSFIIACTLDDIALFLPLGVLGMVFPQIFRFPDKSWAKQVKNSP
jgi:hypothetical protein